MRFSLAIDMDNAAFDGCDAGAELARILEDLSARVRNSWPSIGDSFRLCDENGNRVGEATVTGEDA